MTDPASAATISVIESGYSHFIIIGCAVAGIAWGGINAIFVSDNLDRLRGPARPFASHFSLMKEISHFIFCR